MKETKRKIQERYNKALKDIFKYDNYRTFLKDFFIEQKKIKKQFSHRYFADKAGFSSPSFFINIMKGDRNLSSKSLQKLLSGLEFKDTEEKFFKFLVLYNQAKTVDEKELYYKQLEDIRKNTNFFKINSKQFAYFQKWYLPVVRELVTLAHWDNDYKKLGSLVFPKISAAQAKDAVETLLEINLIKKTETGYKQIDKLLSIESVPTYVKKDLRKHVLLKGIESLDILSPKERYTSFYTIGLSKEAYEDVTELLDKIGTRIMNDALDEEKVNKIYNMALQIYPVSSDIQGEDK